MVLARPPKAPPDIGFSRDTGIALMALTLLLWRCHDIAGVSDAEVHILRKVTFDFDKFQASPTKSDMAVGAQQKEGRLG